MRRGRWFGGAAVTVATLVGCGPAAAPEPMAVGEARENSWVAVSTPSTAAPVTEAVGREAIEEAFATLIERRVQCGRSPESCDVDLIALPGTDVHRSLADLMNERIVNHVVASTTGSLRYRIESVTMVGTDAASLRVCFIDDTVLVQPLPPVVDDVLPPIVVDDSLFSARSDWDLRRTDGEWRWAAEHPVNWAVGEDLCGA